LVKEGIGLLIKKELGSIRRMFATFEILMTLPYRRLETTEISPHFQVTEGMANRGEEKSERIYGKLGRLKRNKLVL